MKVRQFQVCHPLPRYILDTSAIFDFVFFIWHLSDHWIKHYPKVSIFNALIVEFIVSFWLRSAVNVKLLLSPLGSTCGKRSAQTRKLWTVTLCKLNPIKKSWKSLVRCRDNHESGQEHQLDVVSEANKSKHCLAR